MSEMDIGALLADQLRRLADEADGSASREDIWRALIALGLDRAVVSEENGGQGLRWPELAAPLAAWGACGAPAPLAEALAGGWLAERAGFALPDGPILLSDASIPLASWRLSVSPGERSDILRLTDPAGHGEERELAGDLSRAVHAVLLSVQIAGALEGALALSVEHVSARTQFGRPLSRFQAVQRLVAMLGLEAAAARAAAEFGLKRLDDDPSLAAAVAMGRAARAVGVGVACAHQVHGAMGVTEEYPLHRLSKSLWRWRDAAGGEAAWAAVLGDRYLRTAQPLWARLIDDLEPRGAV